MLPIAKSGLEKANIDQQDIDRLLGIIKERTTISQTGSQWILDSYNKLRKKGSKDEATVATTAALFKRQQDDIPVHDWSLAELSEAGSWKNRFQYVRQIMSTDLFTISEDDLIDFVSNIMHWKKIRHVPVENEKGNLIGLLTSRNLIHFLSMPNESHKDDAFVKKIMTTNLITVEPDTPTTEALRLMEEFNVGCLPVTQNKKLVGIITEHDFVRISARIFEELDNVDTDFHME